ncbi:DinB family protein [Longimicrobium sp.]|uniref:DinB family protein n=1 Tax=Longimicrobium sp. TaxID=2029185 RepID=UPI002B965073|nr:DinB family protein [Longimicrobium sp.]HSU13732.1 DinB family protein [Longimicrobium sp.]
MTDTAAAPSARPLAFNDLEPELANTRRALEQVPDEHWDWKPHEKSMTLGRIASHIAELPHLAIIALTRDEFDVADPRDAPKPTNREELLRAFDQAAASLVATVNAVPAEGWKQTWSLKAQGRTFLTMTRAAALRAMGISHSIHHRGQLTVYLRLLDVPVPGLYGPSADEKFG